MTKAAKNVRELEFESISKLMWKYFLPALVGVMMSSLYNVVDRIFIGQGVGAEALSALSAVFPIMIIIVAFGMLIGVGAGVRVSINLGKKDFNRAELVLGNAFVMMLIISVLITGIGLGLKEPLLRFFGVGQATFDYAVEYIDIILWSAVFQVVGYSLNNIIRSEGNAKVAMFSMIITSVLNMLLDPLFIFVFDMGVAGAAYATVLSQVALCVWTIYHFRSKKSVIKLDIAKFKLSGEIIWYIVTIGFSSFMMQLASSLVFGTFNVQLVKYGGDIAVGALGILMSVAMIIIFTCIAINLAGQPIISFNHGANLPARVKQTLLTGMWWATVVCVVGFVLTQIFPHAIIKAFNKDNKELLEVGERGMRLLIKRNNFV